MSIHPAFTNAAANEDEARWFQNLADKFDVLDTERDSYAVMVVGAHDWFFGPDTMTTVNGHRFQWDTTPGAPSDAEQWKRIVREYGDDEGITAVCVDAVRLEDYEDDQTFPLIAFSGPLTLVHQALTVFLADSSVPPISALARYLEDKALDAQWSESVSS